MKYCSNERKTLYVLAISTLLPFFIPVVVFAQDITGVISKLFELVNVAMPVVIGLALLFFFWGVAIYILNEGNAEKKGQGRSIMLWGVIAIFVILSIFGLVKMLQNTFGIDEGQDASIPSLDIPGGGNGSSGDSGTCGIDTNGNIICF